MRRFLAVLALMAGLLSPATSTFGVLGGEAGKNQRGLGVRLVDVPVATADNPRARVYIIDHVSPGALVERRIEVSNRTGARAKVSVYPAAADIEGGSFIGADGRTANELSTWTSVDRGSLNLANGARQLVDFKIKVPSNASPGERYAAVWAETTTTAPSGITQVSRVGIRIYLSVGPGGDPASDFQIESFTSARTADGAAVVRAKVHNTGGRALDLRGTLRLSDGPGGLSAGPFPVTLGTTLGLDQTEPVTVVLDKQLPNGPWKAHLELISGLLKRTAQATLTFPAKPGQGETVKPERGRSVQWWIAVGAVGAALLALFAWLLSRRRKSAHKPSNATGSRMPEQ